jgi:hypothetical protein
MTKVIRDEGGLPYTVPMPVMGWDGDIFSPSYFSFEVGPSSAMRMVGSVCPVSKYENIFLLQTS